MTATATMNIGSIERFNSAFQAIYEAVKSTMGVYGGYTIVENSPKNHVATKDGFSVVKMLASTNQEEDALIHFISAISYNMVRTVGDGSSSAIAIAYNLNKNLQEFSDRNKHIPKTVLIDLLKVILNTSMQLIEKQSKSNKIDLNESVSLETLYHIAFTATNGNEEVANLISKTYFDNKVSTIFVKEKLGYSTDHVVEINNNYEHNRGVVIDEMLDPNNLIESVEFSNPHLIFLPYLLTKDIFSSLATLLVKGAIDNNSTFVILCAGVTPELKKLLESLFTLNKTTKMPFAIVDFSMINEDNRNKLLDMKFLANASSYLNMFKTEEDLVQYYKNLTVNEAKNVLKMFPVISSFKADRRKSSFSGFNKNSEEIDVYIEALESEMNLLDPNSTDLEFKKSLYNHRINKLKQNSAVLHVAGINDQVKASLKYAIDDAVAACTSAIKHGYNFGGNTLIPKLLTDEKNFEIVYDATSEYANDSKLTCITMDTSLIDDLIEDVVVTSYKSVYLDVAFPFENFSTVRVLNKLIKPELKRVLSSLDLGQFYWLEDFLSSSKNSYEDFERVIEFIVLTNESGQNLIFNSRTLKMETLTETSVISSIETEKEIINGVLSILSLVFPSQAILTNPYKPNKE